MTKVKKKKEKTPRKKRLVTQVGHIDYPMLALVIILLVFGLVMLFSASAPNAHLRYGDSYFYVRQQIRYLALGIPVMLLATLFDYRVLKKFAWPLLALAIILLVVVLFMEPFNGAKRWIWLSGSPGRGTSFQPSEIAKFAVIVLFSFLLDAHKNRMGKFKYGFLPFMIILGAIAGLLLLEPHLSCTILILGIGVSMMFAGGSKIKWFIATGLIAAAALGLALLIFPKLVPYAGNRIEGWLNPSPEHHQIWQSLIAVGSGGTFGRGLGESRQKYLYLPEMHNDYIFAVLCEELGLIGALVVLVLFLLLLLRGLYIAAHVQDRFGSLLVIGISVQIALQAILHMGVNTNALPSTGISMPFFSFGGTSLLMLLGQMGVLLAVSRWADVNQKKPAISSEHKGQTPLAKGAST